MTPRPAVFGLAAERLHLIGAGGMGMAPLGLYLAGLGFQVSGEDDGWNPAVRTLLERAGVRIVAPGALPDDAQLVVHSSAIAPAHESRRRATARGLPQVRRGEMLAEVVKGKKLVAVVGSHGKTTTTAMLITVLQRAGFASDWVLGGLFNDSSLPPALVGGSDWIVAEVDESDGTIGRFSPEVTLVVNLDWDHPDHYAKLADLEAAFAALLARTRSAVFISDACPMSARIAARGGFNAPVHTFGRAGEFKGNVLRYTPAGLELTLGGRFALPHAEVRSRGEFNAANATAALAVAQELGAKLRADSLAEFSGVRRRQAVLHASALTIYEDYAHHPTEIRALLGSLKQALSGRLVVVFQPHRYTRTAQFKAEFAAALAGADSLFLMDVYAASEAPVAGGTTADIYAELKKSGAADHVTYLPGNDAGLLRALQAALKPGDTLAFVGAGDIEQSARDFVARLKSTEAREAAWNAFLLAVRPRLAAATRLVERESLANKTTMRVGGPARVYAEPAGAEDLQVLLREMHRRALPVHLLGRGSNLIIPDEGVDGLVISLGHEHWQKFEPHADGRIWAGAGLRLKNLCGLAIKAGFQGFEFLEGIPGSVGGALRMNAGAMGGWMFDVVDEVQLMTLQGEIRTMKKAEMHVDYRHCAELHEAIALGAWLKPAASAQSDDIRRQIDVYQKKRVESQPREPSAGCIFKNPPGNSAGRLIDESGLKGERVGDAEVSTVHANFIVNRGHATSADIIALVKKVRARVKAAKGVDLEPEVLLYGAEWKDVL
ncbi:UDP-N-acetylmuramate dehydrogenase [Oleiharenicola lentus]|uniref:UDP-N-acetylenolpyruvoylglucosamine reductase n=1 Tax=Oleiharenicola lentus TaxID=2508720 RepID=A0A4V1M6W6_9BACT|nr:UDP-N-acetylmuramate dehydrogenase [Oleiharenicola lentus]RXK56829.1 UDP-N-acetylmuramate dehydrogenase [Oleiharenicola lentus]